MDLSTASTLVTSLIPRSNIKRLVLKPAGRSSSLRQSLTACSGYDLVPFTVPTPFA